MPVVDFGELELGIDSAMIEYMNTREEDTLDSLTTMLQQQFANNHYTPAYSFLHTDIYGRTEPISMVDYLALIWSCIVGPNWDIVTKSLVKLGSVSSNTMQFGALYQVLVRETFGEAGFLLISDLVQKGGPIELFCSSGTFKKNIRYIIAEMLKVLVLFPEIVNIILREFENELQHALKSKEFSIQSTFFGERSLLDVAFGWPRGVQVLPDWGLSPDCTLNIHTLSNLKDTSDGSSDLDGYYESARIMINAGWKWHLAGRRDLLNCKSTKKLRSLFINDLVDQRTDLWKQAQQLLPPDELPHLKKGPVLDFNASRVYEALVAQGYLEARERNGVQEILEEEKPLREVLERLIAQFEAKHAELGLPILEFLEKHWYTRMVHFLLSPDPYDEAH
ncbi:hypothetical protein P170DRAFT_473518 [Aspergillus steynii IBT 23096]|uniref:Uncharacterized protein n=1 Tax=Aspergillus steynii IBT 23096 TaxID=1392250 RepID=A0A2I2GAN2_9EURO|nr:uncharacterized protein P170DRAFT_473518 [Aspergillus steynii IBT 23096]PLB49941.1 hypothetical protein P170DRAFT_473518 [Aspergillus steynii IBT 23096]